VIPIRTIVNYCTLRFFFILPAVGTDSSRFPDAPIPTSAFWNPEIRTCPIALLCIFVQECQRLMTRDLKRGGSYYTWVNGEHRGPAKKHRRR
jgi:hypothetical protein